MAGPSAQAHLAGIQPDWSQAQLDVWIDGYLTLLIAQNKAKVLSPSEWDERCKALVEALTSANYPAEAPKKYKARATKVAKAREKEQAAKEKEKAAEAKAKRQAQTLADEAAGQAPCRFSLHERRLPDFGAGPAGRLPGAPPASEFVTYGIFDEYASQFITNFRVDIIEDLEILDDIEASRRFVLEVGIYGRSKRFDIAAKDFASDVGLREALVDSAGADADYEPRMSTVRSAISQLGRQGRVIPRRRRTTNFGWTPEGDAFLSPGGRVTAGGFTAVGPDAELDVDLSGEEHARHLRLRPLKALELQRVKRHLVDDLLPLHSRNVTFSLLGAVAAALLYRFRGDGAGRFALWLQGTTGAGKSFLAQLFANFFGNFGVGAGRVASWSGTANFLQRQGFFFKDSIYLVDDYKPAAVRQADALRVLQNNSDGTGRGRLRVDSTTMTTRPIRGLLVSTGEDVIDRSASSAARSIIVPVTEAGKDLERGKRCLSEMKNYPGVTADFIRDLLAEQRTAAFADRVQEWRDYFYDGIECRQNGLRIAANFALLAAAFCEVAEYLSDVWPGCQEEASRFLNQDLIELRDGMLDEVKDQQDSVVFLAVLAALFEHDAVTVDPGSKTKQIGKRLSPTSRVLCISTHLALEAVQGSLRSQGRALLHATERALLDQLRHDGVLVDEAGKPLPPAGGQASTKASRVNGRALRCFHLDERTLLGPGLSSAPPKPAAAAPGEPDQVPY
jgi:hypothetical protein